MIKVRKENIVIIVLIIAMILAVIGVSYAAFSYSKTGTKVNSITTGSITMSYEESDNVINIDKALPTTDETGKVRLKEGEYFDFTISSEIVGDININYEISAKDVTAGSRKIDGSNIKLYLTRLTDDGEEELMTPETYNEEASANSYTGRPAGEMSLYTSSMSSSESNRYRLRMYVTEEYNPQDDGGNLQFSVKINVYGKDGDKYVPTAVETLLAKVNAEDLDYNTATSAEQKEMWTFSHPETEQTEALTDYRYIGADPNNYVTFNNETWRIIGVFTVDDGTGKMEERLKIIRDESMATVWNSSYNNNWENSTLKNNLNSGDYWNNSLGEESKNMIGDAVWYLGGYLGESASSAYSGERGINVFNGNSTSWIGKIGLIYSSDYIYATSGGATVDRNTCFESDNNYWYAEDPNNNFCVSNDWLFSSLVQWTINAHYTNNYVYTVSDNGYFNENNNNASREMNAQPVTFLKSNIKITDGDGSASNPYILSL